MHAHHHKINPPHSGVVQKRLIIIGLILVVVGIMAALLQPVEITKFFFINRSAIQITQFDINGKKLNIEEFFLAQVKEIVEQGTTEEIPGEFQPYQLIVATLLTGPNEGQEVVIRSDVVSVPAETQLVSPSEYVVLTRLDSSEGYQYFVSEKYRLPAVVIIALIFFGLILATAGLKGLSSMLGLAFSIIIIATYILPRIIAGENPLLTSLGGALIIAIVSLYLAHGFSRRTTIALVSTLLTITIAIFLAVVFTDLAKLYGGSSEEALALKVNRLPNISLAGLLLGGIIIGVLGVLDDVTTAQTAAVEEISRAGGQLSFGELYRRGISVGKEHITSLVNTLVLAYTGAALPLLLLFTTSETVPMWVTINNEIVVEEIIRTLVGSSALVLAVPLSTCFAAYVFSRRQIP